MSKICDYLDLFSLFSCCCVADHGALLDHLKKKGAFNNEGKKDFCTEAEWSARLSQHLLTRLFDEIPRMDISKHHREIVPSNPCPGKEKDTNIGELRPDTSFGKYKSLPICNVSLCFSCCFYCFYNTQLLCTNNLQPWPGIADLRIHVFT